MIISLIKNIVKYIRFYGGGYRCNICNKPVRHFFPFSSDLLQSAKSAGFTYDFKRMETLNFDSCNCPFCLSTDRERLYMLFLDKLLNTKNTSQFILDFAPTQAFSKTVKARSSNQYLSADLFRTDVDLRLDICNMIDVESTKFDIVICSHVLEHVIDPDKALAEIYRILKADGTAIIMVPLFWDVEQTIENPDYNTDELRRKFYGQSDHVRLFSRSDFLKRISLAKFAIKTIDTSSFESKQISKYGIATNSILYVCSKA